MNNRSRIIIAISALSLVLMYFFPIWKISLEAPQYPEGIGLEIWIDTVKGQKKHDLGNINNLNHYIGMKRIEPDSIKELEIMPWIIGFLIVFGLITAMAGRRWLLYTWVGLFIAISLVGLVDFYLWEYDYGHNLDQETAIIKIPGMSYQPPMFGSKQLLNFVATSWPAFGGLVAFLAMGAGLWTSYKEFRPDGNENHSKENDGKGNTAPASIASPALLLMVVSSFVFMGCEPAPREIETGVDRCEHCMMGVSDARYGGELVLTTGKVLVFDAVECLAAYVIEHEVSPHSTWVVDYSKPGVLIRAEEAVYGRSEAWHSPMGLNVAAFERDDAIDPGITYDLLDWQGVLDLVEGQ